MTRRISRGGFLRGALAGGGLGAGGIWLAGGPGRGLAQAGAASEEEVLGLVLLVEQVELALYEEALGAGGLDGELLEFAGTAARQQAQHIEALRGALGSAAGDPPRTDFGDATSDPGRFGTTAARLEDVAVGAYNGGALALSDATLAAAAEIVSVEARHAAWVRSIIGEPPAPEPVDEPLDPEAVREALREIGLR